LGIGANLNHWRQEDFTLAKQMIRYYKSVRETVQNGALYRLALPAQGNFAANQYVSPDKSQSVLFAFLHSQQFGRSLPPLVLRGLDEKATYAVSKFDGQPLTKTGDSTLKLSGAYLMNHGLRLALTGDYDSTSIKLERTTE